MARDDRLYSPDLYKSPVNIMPLMKVFWDLAEPMSLPNKQAVQNTRGNKQNYSTANDPHPMTWTRVCLKCISDMHIRQIYLACISGMYIWHVYMACISGIYIYIYIYIYLSGMRIWHVSLTCISGMHIWHAYLACISGASDLYIWHVYLAFISDIFCW